MKNLLFVIALTLSVSCLYGQTIKRGTTIVLKAGTTGYVTINDQDYMRGSLGTQYVYNATDSTLGMYYMRNGTAFIFPTIDTMYQYGDSSNKKAHSISVLKAWMRANLEYKGN